MPKTLQHRTLYQSDLVRANFVCCRPHDHRCSGEEVSYSPSIVFVRRGLFIKHLGSQTIIADPNHALFFLPDQPYLISHPVPGGDDCLAFHLSAAVYHDLLHRYSDHSSTQQPLTARLTKSTTHLLQQALWQGLTHNQHPSPDLLWDELILNLLVDVFKQAHQLIRPNTSNRFSTRSAHSDLVARVKTLLARCYCENLSLSSLARQVHSTPFHLSRVFHRLTGLPIHRYRTQLRLRQGLHLLTEEKLDTTIMALKLGFSSRGHFSDAFRREFGLSISRFRRIASTAQVRQLSKNLGA